jgi:N-acetylglucosaminyldiphosphoundecaprenol N-acetyl-beta-D-mannosaminyltransferase
VKREVSRYSVLGVPVSATTLSDVTHVIGEDLARQLKGFICVTGVHGVMESQRSVAVMEAHHNAIRVVPDGMPLVWCGKALGLRVERVYGPDLMLEVMRRGAPECWRHALYGSTADVLSDLRVELERAVPGVNVVGSLSPPYEDGIPGSPDEIEELNAMKADVIWVGLSTPKQELWMDRWRAGLHANTLIGVGAAFDFRAGRLKQAPTILQRAGLEWAYRLRREPRRLWKRYARNNPTFLIRIATKPPRRLAAGQLEG